MNPFPTNLMPIRAETELFSRNEEIQEIRVVPKIRKTSSA